MIYTDSERLVKKYTVEDAIKAAYAIIADRFNSRNFKQSVITRDLKEKITLEEMNNISDSVIKEFNSK